jgi:hypothetical protein
MSNRNGRAIVAAFVLGVTLTLTARCASAASPIAITNPDYNGSVSGWSSNMPTFFSGYDTPTAPGSVGGSMFWGHTTQPGPYWIYQTLTATTSASDEYLLSVWFYNDRDTLVISGGTYKLELFAADGGETPATAALLGSSAPINPATIPLNGWSQFSILVDGSTIPGGELGKNLLIAAEIPQGTAWGYADAWSLQNVPEPSAACVLIGVGALTLLRRPVSMHDKKGSLPILSI